MPLTIRKLGKIQSGGPPDVGGSRLQIMFGEIDFDDSYPTNGETMDLSAEIKTLLGVFFDAGPLVLRYDYANKKVKAYWADYDAAADGVLVEVPNTTSLAAQTAIKFVAFGI